MSIIKTFKCDRCPMTAPATGMKKYQLPTGATNFYWGDKSFDLCAKCTGALALFMNGQEVERLARPTLTDSSPVSSTKPKTRNQSEVDILNSPAFR